MSARNAHVILKAPAELRPHPLKKSLPKSAEWQKGGAQFHALVDDIRERGIDHPLLITADNFIVDGELVWLAAKALQLAEIPCIVTSADPAGVIISSLLQRRHLTKSGRVYLVYPLLAQAHADAHKRHLARLRTGNAGTFVTPLYKGQTAEDLAESLGVSRVLFAHAAKVHAIFAKDPEYKALMEPKILRDASGSDREEERPVGLGAVVAGYGGQCTKDKAKGDRGQLALFTEVVEDQFNRIRYWSQLADSDRNAVWKTVDERAARMQEGELKALAEFHNAMAVRLRRALKEGVGAV